MKGDQTDWGNGIFQTKNHRHFNQVVIRTQQLDTTCVSLSEGVSACVTYIYVFGEVISCVAVGDCSINSCAGVSGSKDRTTETCSLVSVQHISLCQTHTHTHTSLNLISKVGKHLS